MNTPIDWPSRAFARNNACRNAARRMPGRRFLMGAFAAVLLASGISTMAAQSFSLLHTFNAGEEGIYPHSTLIEGSDGRLYGTTRLGGNHGVGTIFAMAPSGDDYVVLRHFDVADGGIPYAGLIEGSDGRLYGTTSAGGVSGGGGGTIFAAERDGSEFTVLHRFSTSDGWVPRASLIQGSDGRLFGSTSSGGTTNNGSIFAINPDGTNFTVLRLLNHTTDGRVPLGRLLQAADGRLYGTASESGENGGGTIFSLNPDGTGFSVLRHLSTAIDGANPRAGLVQGSDGRLYGTTYSGGPDGFGGTIFVISPTTGDLTLLHDLYSPGLPEAALIFGSDGRLYGTGLNGVFVLDPDGSGVGSGFTALAILEPTIGSNLKGSVLQASDGRLYGTASTSAGGTAHQFGTIFRLNTDGAGLSVVHQLHHGSRGEQPWGRLVDGGDGRKGDFRAQFLLSRTAPGAGGIDVVGRVDRDKPPASEAPRASGVKKFTLPRAAARNAARPPRAKYVI